MKVNKSTYVFTLKKGKGKKGPAVTLNGNQIPQADTARYVLSLQLDRILTWQTHIFAKRKRLGAKFKKMYWILGRKRKSELSTENKLLLYKTVLKPICPFPDEV